MKDKVILDLSDSAELQDHFARKEPGEPCKLTITATLDEVANKIAVLSITDVQINAYGESGSESGETGEGSEPALQMDWGESQKENNLDKEEEEPANEEK